MHTLSTAQKQYTRSLLTLVLGQRFNAHTSPRSKDLKLGRSPASALVPTIAKSRDVAVLPPRLRPQRQQTSNCRRHQSPPLLLAMDAIP